MRKKGKVFIISAPSGSGKTTLLHELSKKSLKLAQSRSVTTRRPRPGEIHKRDYFFISREEFLKRKKQKKFLEWARVFGEYYATPKEYVCSLTGKGRDVALAIDIKGAKQVKKIIPEAVTIFIMPPSMAVLKNRLLRRNSDTRKQIKNRLCVAKEEIASAGDYDYIIVNDKLHNAVRRLEAIIVAERIRSRR